MQKDTLKTSQKTAIPSDFSIHEPTLKSQINGNQVIM